MKAMKDFREVIQGEPDCLQSLQSACGPLEQEPREHHAGDSTEHGLRSGRNGNHSWHGLVKLDAGGIRKMLVFGELYRR